MTVNDASTLENQPVLYLSQALKESTTERTVAIVRATLPTRNLTTLAPKGSQPYSIVDSANRFLMDSNLNPTAANIFADSRTLQGKFWTNNQTQRGLFLTQAPIAKIEQLPEVNWLSQHEAAVRSLSEDALKQVEETQVTLDCLDQMVQSLHPTLSKLPKSVTVQQLRHKRVNLL